MNETKQTFETAEAFQDYLSGIYYGTECHHKVSICPILATDGVVGMAQEAGAFWLIDAIGSYQNKLNKTEALREFQLWLLTVTEKEGRRSCVLECLPDSDQKAVVRQEIEYTDFPVGTFKLYVENGVCLLPSEH